MKSKVPLLTLEYLDKVEVLLNQLGEEIEKERGCKIVRSEYMLIVQPEIIEIITHMNGFLPREYYSKNDLAQAQDYEIGKISKFIINKQEELYLHLDNSHDCRALHIFCRFHFIDEKTNYDMQVYRWRYTIVRIK